MKHIRQHVAQRKVVWANTVVVTTIKFAFAVSDVHYINQDLAYNNEEY
jgi:hypothetical protein